MVWCWITIKWERLLKLADSRQISRSRTNFIAKSKVSLLWFNEIDVKTLKVLQACVKNYNDENLNEHRNPDQREKLHLHFQTAGHSDDLSDDKPSFSQSHYLRLRERKINSSSKYLRFVLPTSVSWDLSLLQVLLRPIFPFQLLSCLRDIPSVKTLCNGRNLDNTINY